MSSFTEDQIRQALATLNPEDDSHWTEDGAPLLSAIGDPPPKREEVVAVAPNFSRENLDLSSKSPSTDASAGEGANTSPDENSGDVKASFEDEPSSMEECEEALKEAMAALEDAELAKTKAEKIVAKAQARVDQLILERDRISDPPHIDRQKKLMHALNASKQNPSPIDNAFSKIGNRASQRPNFPSKG